MLGLSFKVVDASEDPGSVAASQAHAALQAAVSGATSECVAQTGAYCSYAPVAPTSLTRRADTARHLAPPSPSVYTDAVCVRLLHYIDSGSDWRIRCVLAALSDLMRLPLGTRFHAAVVRTGVLDRLVGAVTCVPRPQGWSVDTLASCSALLSTWADRIWTPPDYRAAAAKLRAAGVLDAPNTGLVHPGVAESAGGDGGPGGTPSHIVTRSGVLVPVRANGGVLAPAPADEMLLDTATKEALRKADAKTAAHVAEHASRGVDYAFERKRERKLLQQIPTEYMGSSSGGGVDSPRGGVGGAGLVMPVSTTHVVPGQPIDVSTPDGAIAAIQAAMRGEMMDAASAARAADIDVPAPALAVQSDAVSRMLDARALPTVTTSPLKAAAAAAARSTSPMAAPLSPPAYLHDPLGATAAVGSPVAELQGALDSVELQADVFVARENASDLSAACAGQDDGTQEGDATPPATDADQPPASVMSMARRCAQSLPRAVALLARTSGDEQSGIHVEAAQLVDELSISLAAFVSRWPTCEAAGAIKSALRSTAEQRRASAAMEHRTSIASSGLGAQLTAMVDAARPALDSTGVVSPGPSEPAHDEHAPVRPEPALSDETGDTDGDTAAAPQQEQQSPVNEEESRPISAADAPAPDTQAAEHVPEDESSRSVVSSGRNVGALLVAAATGGHMNAVRRLLNGITPDGLAATDRKGNTALKAARAGGHTAVVQMLLDAGATE
jgi:hypothetical protein